MKTRIQGAGFTLIELLVTLVLVVVIGGLAVPNMREFVLNSRLTSTANEMLRAIQTTRSHALQRQRSVVFCTSANPTNDAAACATSNVTGWIVFEDTNNNWARESTEPVLEASTFEADKVTLKMDGSWRLNFAPTGFSRPAGTNASTQTPSQSIVLCDHRGNQSVGNQSTARGLFVEPTGRARVTRDVAQINTLLGSSRINASCP